MCVRALPCVFLQSLDWVGNCSAWSRQAIQKFDLTGGNCEGKESQGSRVAVGGADNPDGGYRL